MAGSIERGLLCGVPPGRRRTSEESRDISPVYFGISAIERRILILKDISQDKIKNVFMIPYGETCMVFFC